MSWKNLPTWLKGGIIGAVVGLVGIILYIIMEPLGNALGIYGGYSYPRAFDIIFGGIFLLGAFPVVFIFGSLFLMLSGDTLAGMAGWVFAWLSPLTYIVAGMIIGLIVDKIKSRSKN